MASHYDVFFREVDTDGSGFLTLGEFSAVLRKKGYTDTKIRSMFRACDSSGDDKVSLDEFLKVMGQLPEKDHKAARMRQCFRAFDQNGDGTIDAKELDAVFKSMGKTFSEADLKRMIELSDKDKSGTIDYEEFVEKVYG